MSKYTRESLITELKYLMQVNNSKQAEFQKQNNLRNEVGTITREACMIMALVPQMQELGVTLEDIREEG
ncbi:MAG: hypothetical protein WDA42_00510 [Candidatus Bathyarchaeia archaeon]